MGGFFFFTSPATELPCSHPIYRDTSCGSSDDLPMDSKRPPPRSSRTRSADSEPQDGVPRSKKTRHNLDVFYSGLVLPRGTYRYNPLGPNEIRLLYLFPADNKNDLLASELKVARLDDLHLRYEALSYTWGHEEATEKLWIQSGGQQVPRQPSKSSRQPSAETPRKRLQAIVWRIARERMEKNKTFYVKPNLSDALRHLRNYSGSSPQQSGRRPETLVLWVDFICINQEDKNEKSAQVRIMADIYKRAASVFIWLGREGEESSIGMDFILRIPEQESQGMLSVQGSDAPQWGAFVALMRRAWFSRRWVVQELAFAKHAYLRCGDVSVNWIDFVVAVEFFIERFDTIAALYNDSALFKQKVLAFGDIKASAARKMVTITNEFIRGSREHRDRLKTLEALVSELTMFEAGDPRDSVYAVMALAWDVEEGAERRRRDWRHEAASRPSFQVDYRKDILQVFTDFVAFCVYGSDSLDIICRKWAPNRRVKVLRVADRPRYRGLRPPLEEINLPSWIGLLKDSAYGFTHDRPKVRVASNSLVDTPLIPPYNACGGRKPGVLFGEMSSDPSHGEYCEVGSTKCHDVDL